MFFSFNMNIILKWCPLQAICEYAISLSCQFCVKTAVSEPFKPGNDATAWFPGKRLRREVRGCQKRKTKKYGHGSEPTR